MERNNSSSLRRGIALLDAVAEATASGGATPSAQAKTYQLIRGRLRDLEAATLAAEAVYFTAGEYLALEPAAPPDRWADLLPAEQRAYATANTLSPRLSPAAILDPGHASRVLWATVPECRTLVAELQAL